MPWKEFVWACLWQSGVNIFGEIYILSHSGSAFNQTKQSRANVLDTYRK